MNYEVFDQEPYGSAPIINNTAINQPILMKVDEPCAVTVDISGQPSPQVRWQVGRRGIKESNKYKLKWDGGQKFSLLIVKVTAELDEGISVIANNCHGEDVCKLDVKTYKLWSGHKPSFRNQPGPLRSSESMTITRTPQSDLETMSLEDWQKEMERRNRMRSVDDLVLLAASEEKKIKSRSKHRSSERPSSVASTTCVPSSTRRYGTVPRPASVALTTCADSYSRRDGAPPRPPSAASTTIATSSRRTGPKPPRRQTSSYTSTEAVSAEVTELNAPPVTLDHSSSVSLNVSGTGEYREQKLPDVVRSARRAPKRSGVVKAASNSELDVEPKDSETAGKIFKKKKTTEEVVSNSELVVDSRDSDIVEKAIKKKKKKTTSNTEKAASNLELGMESKDSNGKIIKKKKKKSQSVTNSAARVNHSFDQAGFNRIESDVEGDVIRRSRNPIPTPRTSIYRTSSDAEGINSGSEQLWNLFGVKLHTLCKTLLEDVFEDIDVNEYKNIGSELGGVKTMTVNGTNHVSVANSCESSKVSRGKVTNGLHPKSEGTHQNSPQPLDIPPTSDLKPPKPARRKKIKEREVLDASFTIVGEKRRTKKKRSASRTSQAPSTDRSSIESLFREYASGNASGNESVGSSQSAVDGRGLTNQSSIPIVILPIGVPAQGIVKDKGLNNSKETDFPISENLTSLNNSVQLSKRRQKKTSRKSSEVEAEKFQNDVSIVRETNSLQHIVPVETVSDAVECSNNVPKVEAVPIQVESIADNLEIRKSKRRRKSSGKKSEKLTKQQVEELGQEENIVQEANDFEEYTEEDIATVLNSRNDLLQNDPFQKDPLRNDQSQNNQNSAQNNAMRCDDVEMEKKLLNIQKSSAAVKTSKKKKIKTSSFNQSDVIQDSSTNMIPKMEENVQQILKTTEGLDQQTEKDLSKRRQKKTAKNNADKEEALVREVEATNRQPTGYDELGERKNLIEEYAKSSTEMANVDATGEFSNLILSSENDVRNVSSSLIKGSKGKTNRNINSTTLTPEGGAISDDLTKRGKGKTGKATDAAISSQVDSGAAVDDESRQEFMNVRSSILADRGHSKSPLADSVIAVQADTVNATNATGEVFDVQQHTVDNDEVFEPGECLPWPEPPPPLDLSFVESSGKIGGKKKRRKSGKKDDASLNTSSNANDDFVISENADREIIAVEMSSNVFRMDESAKLPASSTSMQRTVSISTAPESKISVSSSKIAMSSSNMSVSAIETLVSSSETAVASSKTLILTSKISESPLKASVLSSETPVSFSETAYSSETYASKTSVLSTTVSSSNVSAHQYSSVSSQRLITPRTEVVSPGVVAHGLKTTMADSRMSTFVYLGDNTSKGQDRSASASVKQSSLLGASTKSGSSASLNVKQQTWKTTNSPNAAETNVRDDQQLKEDYLASNSRERRYVNLEELNASDISNKSNNVLQPEVPQNRCISLGLTSGALGSDRVTDVITSKTPNIVLEVAAPNDDFTSETESEVSAEESMDDISGTKFADISLPMIDDEIIEVQHSDNIILEEDEEEEEAEQQQQQQREKNARQNEERSNSDEDSVLVERTQKQQDDEEKSDDAILVTNGSIQIEIQTGDVLDLVKFDNASNASSKVSSPDGPPPELPKSSPPALVESDTTGSPLHAGFITSGSTSTVKLPSVCPTTSTSISDILPTTESASVIKNLPTLHDSLGDLATPVSTNIAKPHDGSTTTSTVAFTTDTFTISSTDISTSVSAAASFHYALTSVNAAAVTAASNTPTVTTIRVLASSAIASNTTAPPTTVARATATPTAANADVFVCSATKSVPDSSAKYYSAATVVNMAVPEDDYDDEDDCDYDDYEYDSSDIDSDSNDVDNSDDDIAMCEILKSVCEPSRSKSALSQNNLVLDVSEKKTELQLQNTLSKENDTVKESIIISSSEGLPNLTTPTINSSSVQLKNTANTGQATKPPLPIQENTKPPLPIQDNKTIFEPKWGKTPSVMKAEVVSVEPVSTSLGYFARRGSWNSRNRDNQDDMTPIFLPVLPIPPALQNPLRLPKPVKRDILSFELMPLDSNESSDSTINSQVKSITSGDNNVNTTKTDTDLKSKAESSETTERGNATLSSKVTYSNSSQNFARESGEGLEKSSTKLSNTFTYKTSSSQTSEKSEIKTIASRHSASSGDGFGGVIREGRRTEISTQTDDSMFQSSNDQFCSYASNETSLTNSYEYARQEADDSDDSVEQEGLSLSCDLSLQSDTVEPVGRQSLAESGRDCKSNRLSLKEDQSFEDFVKINKDYLIKNLTDK